MTDRRLTHAVIVGSGPSAKGFIPPDNVSIIAVNGTVDWLPRVDHFFTLDPSTDNMRRLRQRRDGVHYHAAGLYTILPGISSYQRLYSLGVEPTDRYSPTWWLWRWSAVLGLSEDKARIHTGNSAYGALGLAYHLGFQNVALIGVDATTEPRIEGGKPRNLSHLPLLFASALDQINVVSCGRLSGIPSMGMEEWLDG